MRTLASYQFGQGLIADSIPVLAVIFELILLLVLFYFKRFFSGYSGFPLSSKTNNSKFQFDLDTVPNWHRVIYLFKKDRASGNSRYNRRHFQWLLDFLKVRFRVVRDRGENGLFSPKTREFLPT